MTGHREQRTCRDVLDAQSSLGSQLAQQEFEVAQKIDPNSEDVALNLARLYGESGDLKKAIDTLKAVPEDDRTAKLAFALWGLWRMRPWAFWALPAAMAVDDVVVWAMGELRPAVVVVQTLVVLLVLAFKPRGSGWW